jgi:hypothetical protein
MDVQDVVRFDRDTAATEPAAREHKPPGETRSGIDLDLFDHAYLCARGRVGEKSVTVPQPVVAVQPRRVLDTRRPLQRYGRYFGQAAHEVSS